MTIADGVRRAVQAHQRSGQLVDKIARIAEGYRGALDAASDGEAAARIRQVAGNDRALIGRALKRFVEQYDADNTDDYLSARSAQRLRLALDPAYQIAPERAECYRTEQLVFNLTELAGDMAVDDSWRNPAEAVERLRDLAAGSTEILRRARDGLGSDDPAGVIGAILLAAAAGEPLEGGELNEAGERVGLDDFAALWRGSRDRVSTVGWDLLCQRAPELASWAEQAVALSHSRADSPEMLTWDRSVQVGLGRLLGPESGSEDLLLRTDLAHAVAWLHLRDLSGRLDDNA
jgi:hypothetical protein